MNPEWKYRISMLRHPFSVSAIFYDIQAIEDYLYSVIPEKDTIDFQIVVEIYHIATDMHGWFSASIQYSRYNRFHHIQSWIKNILNTVEESKFKLRYSNGPI